MMEPAAGSPQMPSCHDVALLLSDHMDRALPWRRRLGLEAHLALCPNCRTYAAQLRETLALTRVAGQAAPPADPEAEAAVLELFDNWRSKGT